jgi:hypothetical protein
MDFKSLVNIFFRKKIPSKSCRKPRDYGSAEKPLVGYYGIPPLNILENMAKNITYNAKIPGLIFETQMGVVGGWRETIAL